MANQYKNKVVYNGTTLIDISDTTAVQSDVASGKSFYSASGQKVLGTGNIGASVTITDEANATGITCVITTGQTPTPTPTPTPSGNIPLNTQLIDFTKVKMGYILEGTDGSEVANEYGAISDYTQIDPSMTFTYVGYQWWDSVFYDSSKAFIGSFTNKDYADTTDETDNAHGTLTSSRIPSNAVYIRISAVTNYDDNDGLSLIRTT